MTIDWTSIFQPSLGIAEIVVRGTLVYLALFLIFRLVVRRQSRSFGPAALLAIVRTAFPQLAPQLGQIEVLVTAMGQNPRLPLSVAKGVVRMGFFTLGVIPPLD